MTISPEVAVFIIQIVLPVLIFYAIIHWINDIVAPKRDKTCVRCEHSMLRIIDENASGIDGIELYCKKYKVYVETPCEGCKRNGDDQ